MGISQSKVLRDAIQKGFSDGASGPSMAEMMSDVMGCIDGAADASVKYKEVSRKGILKRYGKNSR
jgi:hypothetical protein